MHLLEEQTLSWKSFLVEEMACILESGPNRLWRKRGTIVLQKYCPRWCLIDEVTTFISLMRIKKGI
jgi:hypothetical protein